MKYLLLLLLVSYPVQASKIECVRWTWSGDVYNRKVICLEWREKESYKEKKEKRTLPRRIGQPLKEGVDVIGRDDAFEQISQINKY